MFTNNRVPSEHRDICNHPSQLSGSHSVTSIMTTLTIVSHEYPETWGDLQPICSFVVGDFAFAQRQRFSIYQIKSCVVFILKAYPTRYFGFLINLATIWKLFYHRCININITTCGCELTTRWAVFTKCNCGTSTWRIGDLIKCNP